METNTSTLSFLELKRMMLIKHRLSMKRLASLSFCNVKLNLWMASELIGIGEYNLLRVQWPIFMFPIATYNLLSPIKSRKLYKSYVEI
jgi:hypothetical protein